MRPEPMEEKLSKEWGLGTQKEITEKIFEDYSDGDKLTRILDTDKLVVCSYALGRILADFKVGLKAAQLRRFYDSLLSVKAVVSRARMGSDSTRAFTSQVLPQVRKLKPQLANAAARQPREVTPFFEVVNPLLDTVHDIADYERLCDFVEAIIAYHKYCGGRD